MKSYFRVFTLLCCFAMIGNAQVSKQRENVESGLRLMEITERGPVQTEATASLLERIAHYNIPGVSITVIDNFTISWSKAYGTLEAGTERAANTNSIYQAGSISKAVTAAIALQFVQQGLLDLDTDVNKYLTSWQVPENEYTKVQKVTLRHLLSHRAGLPNTNFSYDETAGLPTVIQMLNGQPPALNKPAVINWAPGSKYHYSNLGFVVVQQILEDVLGKPFEQIARDTIFLPLGMQSSTFNHPLPAAWQSREAPPHSSNGEALKPAQSTPARAQGGLMTTANDLALYTIEMMLAINGKSDKVFSQKTAKQLCVRHSDVPPQEFGIPFGLGLGVYLYGEGEELSLLHKGSSYPGSEAIFIGFPGRGQGAVILINSNNGGLLILELFASLVEEYGWPSGDYFKQK